MPNASHTTQTTAFERIDYTYDRMRELLLQPRNSNVNDDAHAAIFWNACISAYYHCKESQRSEVLTHLAATLDRLENLLEKNKIKNTV